MRALQKKWYAKLRKSGFKDIENTNSPKEFLTVWHSTHFFKSYTPETFEHKENYYRKASQFFHEYNFENKTAQKVWELHCEGMSYRQIAKALNLTLSGGGKDAVVTTIWNLQEIMRTWEFEDG